VADFDIEKMILTKWPNDQNDRKSCLFPDLVDSFLLIFWCGWQPFYWGKLTVFLTSLTMFLGSLTKIIILLKKNAQTFETRNDGVVSSQCLSKEEVFKAPTCQEAFFGKKGALLREEGPFTSGRRTIYFGKDKKNPLRIAIKTQRWKHQPKAKAVVKQRVLMAVHEQSEKRRLGVFRHKNIYN